MQLLTVSYRAMESNGLEVTGEIYMLGIPGKQSTDKFIKDTIKERHPTVQVIQKISFDSVSDECEITPTELQKKLSKDRKAIIWPSQSSAAF